MTMPSATAPSHRSRDLRMALAFAATIFAVTLGARWASVLGVALPDDFAARALMALSGLYLMATGNSIPKRLVPASAWGSSPARVQAFLRFSGWTWVLAGFALVLASAALPFGLVTLVTLTVLPASILLVAWRWAGLAPAQAPRA